MKLRFLSGLKRDKTSRSPVAAAVANNDTSTAKQQAVPQHPLIPVDLSGPPKMFWWGEGLCAGIIPLAVIQDPLFRDNSLDLKLLEKILTKSHVAIKEALRLEVKPWQIAALNGMSNTLEKNYGEKLADLEDGIGNGVIEYYILGGQVKCVEAWLLRNGKLLAGNTQAVFRLAELTAGAGHAQILELLQIHCKFNLAYFDNARNQTLLHRAVACGQEQTVQWLLEKGVDHTKGRNLALEAAEHNQWKLYSKFVKLKLSPKTIEELNALMIHAARAGKNTIITKIVTAVGDDISRVKYAGLDMVASAASGGQLETLEFCWGKNCGSVTQRWETNMTILHIAACKGQVKLIWNLLQKYSKDLWCDMQDDLGQSILFYAAMSGDWDAFYSLLRSYFKPEDLLKPNNFGETIVHIAASYGHLLFLQQLLQYVDKACLHQPDKLQKTALHHACTSGNSALIIWLVREQGLSLADVDQYNNTPLHLLAQQAERNPSLWKVLVKIAQEFGTDHVIEPRDGEGKTPMDYLREANHHEPLEELNALFSSQRSLH